MIHLLDTIMMFNFNSAHGSRPPAGSSTWQRSCRPSLRTLRCPPFSAPMRRRRWRWPRLRAAWCQRAWLRGNKEGNSWGTHGKNMLCKNWRNRMEKDGKGRNMNVSPNNMKKLD